MLEANAATAKKLADTNEYTLMISFQLHTIREEDLLIDALPIATNTTTTDRRTDQATPAEFGYVTPNTRQSRAGRYDQRCMSQCFIFHVSSCVINIFYWLGEELME